MTPHYAPVLDARQYVDWYVLRRAASTMWHAQEQWFAGFVEALVEGRGSDPQLSVLSVGSGDGSVDLRWASLLAQRCGGLRYATVEPNPAHFERLRERFAASSLSTRAGFELSAYPCKFEDLPALRGFDLIHFVHCVQWLDELEPSIARARSLLAPGGRIVIVQQSASGDVPQLHARFMPLFKGDTRGSLPSETVSTRLAAVGIDSRIELVDAQLDVRAYLDGEREGVQMMSFVLGCDLSTLDAARHELLRATLEGIARKHGEGRLISEPVGVVVIDETAGDR